jgi:cobaltochelatase CobS
MITKKKRKPKKAGWFEIPNTTVKMKPRAEHHEDAPEIKPYIFNQKQVQQIAVGVKLGLNIALTGPTGCGKTTLPTQLAAQLGYPVIRFNCNGETRVSSMVGMDRPAVQDGALTLKFSPAALIKAMREGYWVILDEIDAALPSVLFVLQPVLEEDNRQLFVPELNETVEAHDDFRIFATGNTFGYRATARSAHAGTNPMNDAFVDRFGMLIACDYPNRAEELERLKVNCPDVSPLALDGISRVAEALRSDEKFKADFSTRRCVQWARLVPELGGLPMIFDAAECAVVRKLRNPTDAAVTREVMQRIFGGKR